MVLLWVLIQLPPVQTYLTQKISDSFLEEKGMRAAIGGIDIRFPTEVMLKDVTLFDQKEDTLASFSAMNAGGLSKAVLQGKVEARKVELIDPEFHLSIAEGDSLTNLDYLINAFPSSEDTTSSPFVLDVSNVLIRNGRFTFHDFNLQPIDTLIDFDHISISGLDLEVKDLYQSGNNLTADIETLKFIESKGFILNDLQGEFAMKQDTLQLKEMYLSTPQSTLSGEVLFKHSDWADYSDFIDKVYMKGRFNRSTIHFKDIAFFSTELQGLDRSVEFEGNVRGTVNNLKGRKLYVKLDNNTWFKGRVDLAGLPEFDETFIDLSITELHANKAELDRIPLYPFDSNKTLQTPANFKQLGDLQFEGKFTGFTNDFVAFGTLQTALGAVDTDIKLKEEEKYTYTGKIATYDFDLGQFYNSPELGKLSSNFTIDGSGLTRDDLDATVNGTIQAFRVRGYDYHNVLCSGGFKQDYFNGNVIINDPNAYLTFDGLIDFSKAKPELDFQTDITHLNPVALNLLELDNYTSLSGDFNINSSGLDLNEINGQLSGKNILFCTAESEYPIETLELSLYQGEKGKEFKLDSDIASGYLKGKFDFKGLESGVRNIVADIIPHVDPPENAEKGREDFELLINVHNFELVTEVFLPELKVAPNSRFSLEMDDITDEFEATFTSDRIQYEQFILDTLLLDISHPDEALYATVLTDRFTIENGAFFDQISIDMRNDADTVYTNFDWGKTGGVFRGSIAGSSIIQSNEDIYNQLHQSNFWFDNAEWSLVDTASIHFLGDRIDISNLHQKHQQSYLKVDGTIEDNPRRKLEIGLNGIRLEMFDPFLATAGITQKGLVAGDITIRDPLGKTYISSDLTVLDYEINDYLIGDLCTESAWLAGEQRLLLGGEIERQGFKTLDFGGFYYPSRTDSPLDLTCHLNEQPLEFINAFVTEGISDIKGAISGDIAITGTPTEPLLDGNLNFNEASVLVDYLNTRYYLSQSARVLPDAFWLDFPVRDELGNEGFMAGTIMHDNFANWNFDVFLDIEEEPFLVLNTEETDNSLYFGKALVKGYVGIFGADDNLDIDINVESQKGTDIALPLGGSEEVAFEDFITFVNTDEPEEEEAVDLSGITMNFELDITEDASFRIIFDELVGDEIKGRGHGHVNMVINNLNTFNMYGDVAVTEGRYLFTLKNLLNKEFKVVPDGRISWYGDPLAADIDLKAQYKLNAALYDLLPDETEQYRQRVPVNLNMLLSGKLLSPAVVFDVELPTTDDLTRARVDAAINTEQEMNRQAFALLVLRRFISPPEIAKTNTNLGLAENSTELLTSQVSNWLSQISDDFDIGVNYSPGDEISNEELAVALSTQLFNDRLLVSGNLGVAHAQNAAAGENPNSLIGDIRIEYKVTKDGKIRVIVYNESNQFDLAATQQAAYTQGLGIVYQQEFNSLYDLFRINE